MPKKENVLILYVKWSKLCIAYHTALFTDARIDCSFNQWGNFHLQMSGSLETEFSTLIEIYFYFQVEDLLKRLDYVENDWNVLAKAPRRFGASVTVPVYWDDCVAWYICAGYYVTIRWYAACIICFLRPGFERGISEVSGVTERSELFQPFQNSIEVPIGSIFISSWAAMSLDIRYFWDGIWKHTLTKIIQGWYFTAENTPANHNPRKPDPPTIARHKIVNPKVILNIGGLKHEVFETFYDPAFENTSPNKSAF